MDRRNPFSSRPAKFGQPGTGGWQIVYTGFILILLCFFIMLTSFASLEQSKITQFVQSFSTAVSVTGGGQNLEPGQTMVNSNAVVLNKENRIAELFETVKEFGRNNDLDQVGISRDKRGVILTLTDKMLFESGNAELSALSDGLLKKISKMINTIGMQVDIEGHTDDKPIHSKRYASNWELSTARAVNVLRYLIAEGNIDPRRLSAVGLSKFHPVVANTTTENRARNRRVEFILKPETP